MCIEVKLYFYVKAFFTALFFHVSQVAEIPTSSLKAGERRGINSSLQHFIYSIGLCMHGRPNESLKMQLLLKQKI